MSNKLTIERLRRMLRGKSLTNRERRFFNNTLSRYLRAENGVEATMGGLTDIGFNYNGAWGGPSMAMGGGIPGTVGFTYARTQSPAPSNGPYAKKTKASAQNGMEMKYWQEGLDWKPKTISKNGGWLEKYQEGGIIEDPMGQLAYPGEITRIPSNEITMQGVNYPVLGISDTGDTQMMQPGQDYTFDGSSVTEIPMAQLGEVVPLKQLMRQENEKLKGKSDATKVVPQKTMTVEQADKLKAKRDTQELARRKQAIAASEAAKKKPFSLQQLAEETGAISDKLRIFPEDPDSFIDEYLNPGVMIGDMASALGRAPLNISEGNYGQAAMSVALPLATGALEIAAEPLLGKVLNTASQLPGIKPVVDFAKAGVDYIDSRYVIPYQFRKDIAELNALNESFSSRFTSNPEANRRLSRVLKIDASQMEKPSLTYMPIPDRTSYLGSLNNINIDFRQLQRFKNLGYDISPKTAYEHEFGHYLQREAYRMSPEYSKEIDSYIDDMNLYNKEWENSRSKSFKSKIDELLSVPLFPPVEPTPRSRPTVIDNYLHNMYGNPDVLRQPLSVRGALDFDYFSTGGVDKGELLSLTEPMPHLREMRQNMLEQGIIKDLYEPISNEQIKQFLGTKSGDRMARFTSHKSEDAIKGLNKALRNLPAVIPAAVAATQLSEKENGGWLNKYE